MKLTDEQLEQILKEAPQGAIEYCLYDYGDATHPLFLNCENQFYEEEWVDMLLVDNYFHSRTRLSDLREILTLRQRVQELEGLNQAVVEQAPEVAKLVKALEEMIYVANMVDNWESFPFYPIERAEEAIRAYQKQVGEKHDN